MSMTRPASARAGGLKASLDAARQELRAAFSGDGFVFGGESLRVLLKAFDTKKLRLERFLIRVTARFTH